MDSIDFSLAIDVLGVLERLLNDPAAASKQPDQLHVRDHFHFSDLTPGVVVAEGLQLASERFAVCLLFKINLA